MESLFETQAAAPLLIGGWPDPTRREVRYGVEIPGALSFLATNDFGATVPGLDQVPREDWPNVRVTLSGRRMDQYAATTINRRLAAISAQ